MTDAAISERADFGLIRYAQLWEDADILVEAMGNVAGRDLVSICSGGDNALALLLTDPAHVHAVDLSPAQIACLELRIVAYRSLDHGAFLTLMGARPGDRASAFERVLSLLPPDAKAVWQPLRDDVLRYGAGGVGKFESYFRLFNRWLLPLVHSQKTITDIFHPRNHAAREAFFRDRFNTWRWRLLVRVFFSRFVMARMGRDQAFFDHVQGSVSDHVFRRLHHAAVQTDPAQNPYLHWIMTGTHGTALPLAWRPEAFEVIRDRLDRITPHLGPLEHLDLRDVAGFNLSDIFEYMSPEQAAKAYGHLLKMAAPGARLVYWNMMVPRRVPARFADRITTLHDLEDRLKTEDKAFFYSDFVIEEVR